MATDRKKRNIKHKKPKLSEKRTVETAKDENDGTASRSRLELINGTRKRNRIIRIICYALAVAVTVTLFVVNSLMPTGLIEAMQNAYATVGKGEFPIRVYGTNASYFSCWNGIMSVVNDSFFELYDVDGKLLQAVSHGMSDPVLERSKARYLLYDRNRYALKVYNYSDELYTVETDKKISAATIGNSGTFAVVTDSDTYYNTVYVYNKNNEKVYTWNSANYYVTDAAVSSDGERVAVSLIGSENGAFKSFVYILDYDRAEPLYTFSFEDIVPSLSSCGENYILANGFDRAYTVPWDGTASVDIGVSGAVRCFDGDVTGNSCVVYGRSDNENSNNVAVMDQNGRITASFAYNSTVTDVCVSADKIAVLSDNEVALFSLNGESLGTVKTETKGLFAGITDNGDIMLLDNTKITFIGKE